MKKYVRVIALSAVIAVSCLNVFKVYQTNNIYANESTSNSISTKEGIEEVITEEVDLSAKAREYSTNELSQEYENYKTITLADNASTSNSSNVTINGNIITINEAGAYVISGKLTNGQVVVNCKTEEKVQLVLNGVDITNTTQSPIYIKKAKDYVMLTLADETINTLTDSTIYILEEEQTEELDATIYSKDDMVINGTGTLNVNANYNDGIKSNDTLTIVSGIINVKSAHDAIYGQDSLTIYDGIVNITTGSGAEAKVMAINEFSAGMNQNRGRDIFSGEEMMFSPDMEKAEMNFGGGKMMPPDMNFEGMMPPDNAGKAKVKGEFNTDNSVSDIEEIDEGSFKGLKSKGEVVIYNGTFVLDTYDDGISANTFIEINGGDITIKSGDDGIKADYLLTVNDANIDVSYSYEGIESKVIYFNGGNIKVSSVDDGINASDPDATEEGRPGNPFGSGAEIDVDKDPVIYVNGSNIYVVASGDAVDSNGGIIMNDGALEVHGVNNGGELAVDFDKSFILNGGELLVLGGSGDMSSNSTQNVISLSLGGTALRGDTLTVSNSKGEIIFQTVLEKDTTAVTFSSSLVTKGETYTITSRDVETSIMASTTETVTSNIESIMNGGMNGGGGRNKGQ